MPHSQLTNPKVYHTLPGAPLRSSKHLDHHTIWVFVPFHYRHVSLPCVVGECIRHLFHVLQSGRFQAVPEFAWSEGKRNSTDAFRAHWPNSKVHGDSAPTTVGCCDTSYVGCHEKSEIQSLLQDLLRRASTHIANRRTGSVVDGHSCLALLSYDPSYDRLYGLERPQ